ncbi:MAG: hypothetical protein OXG05_07960 [Gammaproteobacteria bacterium]|nr:hypothetical protein [Gammaproteobacteria bacterium]
MSVLMLVRNKNDQTATFTYDAGSITADRSDEWVQNLLEYLRGANHWLPMIGFREWEEQRDKFEGEEAGPVTPIFVERKLDNEGEFYHALEDLVRRVRSDFGVVEIRHVGECPPSCFG